ncbi:hypothetical protein MbovBow_04060 [Mycoplasmopsis bovis]
MNKRKLRLSLALTSSLIPAAALSLSAFGYVPAGSTRYYDFPDKKYEAKIEYENKNIWFQNNFEVPAEVPNSTARTKFFMRTWEPSKWEDVSKSYEALEKGKWKIIDSNFYIDDPMDNGCIDYGDPTVCAPTFYTNAKGFEKTNEYSNLNDLLSSIYWKNLKTDDENINKNPFINTFKYFVTKNLNKQFNEYGILEKYIKKITMYQAAKNMIVDHEYTVSDRREQYEFLTGNIEYKKEGYWDHITDYKITVDLRIPKEVIHPFSAYKNDFNSLKNKLSKENWTIESDTGGKLNSDEIKKEGFETNESKLDKKLQKFNKDNNRSKLKAEL